MSEAADHRKRQSFRAALNWGFFGLFFVYLFSVRLCSWRGQEEGADSVSVMLNLYVVKWRCPGRQLARNLEAPEWGSRLKINFEIFCL